MQSNQQNCGSVSTMFSPHRFPTVSLTSSSSEVPKKQTESIEFSDGWRNLCKDNFTNISKSRRSSFGLISQEEACANQSQHQSDHTKITSYRRTTVGANSREGETLCKVVNITVVSLRRKMPIKLSWRNCRIQTHS